MKPNSTLNKACAFMTSYSKATGSFACVFDQDLSPVGERQDKMPISPFGDLCLGALKETRGLGASSIYPGGNGLSFWTSPITSGGHFAGALLAGSTSEQEEEKRTSLVELLNICARSVCETGEGHRLSTKERSRLQTELSAKITEMKNRTPAPQLQEYPQKEEQKLLDALQKGDIETSRQILNEILAFLTLANPSKFNLVKYMAIELAFMLSRLGIRQTFSLETVLDNDKRNLASIQKSKNLEELAFAMHNIVDDLSGQIHRFRGIQHSSALRKAEQFIQKNYSRKLSLDEIAGVSGFSAPYFSTIFKQEMGENLSGYLTRLRVEKAASMLLSTNLSLNSIARACGIEDQRWFSKVFKAQKGISPGKYRCQGGV
jgi:YesN/AraC family two-component response regulator